MIIAIDGPSGAGKSTLGKMLAKQLVLLYLDTGAMYRAVAVSALHQGTSFNDAEGLTKTAESAKIDLVSGATFTSDAYVQSLQSALDAAAAHG